MGFLLKIILFGVAVYAAWKTFHRWKSLFDRFVGRPEEPPKQAPPPSPAPPSAPGPLSSRKVTVEDTVQCPACGAYNSATAEKCGQCGHPQSPGRGNG